MPITNKPSRRRLLLLAGAALGTSMLGGLGRLALADSDDDDSDDHYEESANTSFAPAYTGLNARIVVVGGGMAGATAAKYLRLWGGTGLQITLVEPAARYTSNIMSNLVLNGSRNIATLSYGYDSLAPSTASASRWPGSSPSTPPRAPWPSPTAAACPTTG